MKAIILAAGRGRRMMPLTADTPKPLLPVAGKPIVRHSVDLLEEMVDETIIVGGYLHEELRNEFSDDPHVRLVRQRELDGTAVAALEASRHVDGEALIVNGDDIYEGLERIAESGPAVLAAEAGEPERYGVLDVEDGEMEGLEEKPEDPPGRMVYTGCMKVEDDFFELLEDVERSSRGEREITDALVEYARRRTVEVVEAEGWHPCSYPWQLLEANNALLDEGLDRSLRGRVAGSATIRGQVRVEEGAEVREGAVLEGPVLVKEDAVVGTGSLIRGASVIHGGVEVRNSEVKNSILREGCDLRHFGYVGDSYLGSDVNMGAGAKTANLRHDGKTVRYELEDEMVDTGREKLGMIAGSEVSLGVNSSVKPGRRLGRGAMVDAGETVERSLPAGSLQSDGEIVEDRG